MSEIPYKHWTQIEGNFAYSLKKQQFLMRSRKLTPILNGSDE